LTETWNCFFCFNIIFVDLSALQKILILYLCFCYFQACISTDNIKTGDQHEDGQYQKCVPTPSVDARAKLEDSHFQACIYTDNIKTGDQQEDGQYQKCVPTPSVDARAKLEDKPADCKLDVNKSVIN
jgi:hypothetical protein